MRSALFLFSMLALTATAWLAHVILRRRQIRSLRSLAVQWHMQYSPCDLFNLASRLAPQFPLPGAADLRLLDLIYASEGPLHRYLFTAEYTRGVSGRHRREQLAMTFCEPSEPVPNAPAAPLISAPSELPLLEQYRHLHDQSKVAHAGDRHGQLHLA